MTTTQVNYTSTIMMTGDQLADLIRRSFKIDGWLTIREAAAYVRATRATVYEWIKKGKLPAYAPVEGRMIVRIRDIDGLCRKHRVDPEHASTHAAATAASIVKRKMRAREVPAATGTGLPLLFAKPRTGSNP